MRTIKATRFESTHDYEYNMQHVTVMNYSTFKNPPNPDINLCGENEYPKVNIYDRSGTFYVSADENFISDSKTKLVNMQIKDFDKKRRFWHLF